MTNGFEVPRDIYSLQFEGKYQGAEIKCASADLRTLFSIAKLADTQEISDVEKAITEFADKVLISWNLKVNGIPLPTNAENMLSLPLAFSQLIIKTWITAATEVESPLQQSSQNGDSSQALSTLTEQLSKNQPN